MGIQNSSAEVLGPFCTLHFALCIQMVEPEVVATSPCPIKSRVPVCCGFGSVKKWCSRSRCIGTLATLSTSCLCCWTTRAWVLQPVPPRQGFFTKEIRRLLRGGKVEFQLAVKREASKDRATASPNNDGCDVASLW